MSVEKMKINFEGEFITGTIEMKPDPDTPNFPKRTVSITHKVYPIKSKEYFNPHNEIPLLIHAFNQVLNATTQDNFPGKYYIAGAELDIDDYQSLQAYRNELEAFYEIERKNWNNWSNRRVIKNLPSEYHIPHNIYKEESTNKPVVLEYVEGDSHPAGPWGEYLIDIPYAHEHLHPSTLSNAERVDNYYKFDIYEPAIHYELPQFFGAYDIDWVKDNQKHYIEEVGEEFLKQKLDKLKQSKNDTQIPF